MPPKCKPPRTRSGPTLKDNVTKRCEIPCSSLKHPAKSVRAECKAYAKTGKEQPRKADMSEELPKKTTLSKKETNTSRAGVS